MLPVKGQKEPIMKKKRYFVFLAIVISISTISLTCYSAEIDRAEKYYNEGKLHYRGGDYESAYTSFKKAMKIFRQLRAESSILTSTYVFPLIYTGRAALYSGNSEEAIPYLEEALEIYNEVRKEMPNISLGTVYRNLRLLCQSGEIAELDLCGNLSRFDARQDDHYHFRCEKCGSVFDVDEPVDREIDGRIARKTGFSVTHHKLEFRGLCRECQNS